MTNDRTTYRIDGFSCANCARTFEKNVQEINGVEDAQVNFGASKITVQGAATVEDIEKAGAFEQLKVVNASGPAPERQSFFKKHRMVILSAILMFIGFALIIYYGGQNPMTTGFFLASVVTGGYRMFWTGLNNLTRLRFDMKTLMTVAIIGAALIGEWPEASVVVVLFAVSEALERYSMEKARTSIQSLMEIAPNTASVKTQDGIREVEVGDIQIGDTIIVRPGEKLPMDGVISSGHSSINQAAITGESLPVEVSGGEEVYAGTLNQNGYLEIEVTKNVEDTTIAKIIQLVEEAQEKRAPAQQFVDQFAKYYTPAIMMIAVMVAVIPPLLFGAEWMTYIYQGLAILVVGCPCALVISTPIAIVSAIGNAANRGVLIKGGVHLEKIGQSSLVAFDKTGTLKKGEPHVTDFEAASNRSREEVLAIAAALESQSEHPIAQSVIKYAESEGIRYSDIDINRFKAVTGTGISGEIGQRFYEIRKPDGEPLSAQYQDDGKTAMIIIEDDQIIGHIAVMDELRESSTPAIEKLHNLGIQTAMLTGDNSNTARTIARTLGIDKIYAGLMPEDKLATIEDLKKEHTVAMVGDGINDAPALATANVGVAMGKGTDTALETADMALMGNSIHHLPFAIGLSRRTLNIIKANISFAIIIKVIALLLVIPGWLTLWIAILSDIGATLIVALNGLRLLRMKE
ncbi:heavy metal translocating P-type ATPase [Salinicoccus roseus]|uniref:heavy metal translocating P-type ATPase n=1 Tax=Salinicoccus roseus TaxID=45670 RepID=UPI00230032CC|nr:heavy metal translocating P-type ATPase [Salinicoccus roseus]